MNGEGNMLVKLFGYTLAAGILATSLAMMWLGGRWQKVEASAYAGERRPWWFWLGSLLLVGLYLAALVSFISGEKTWAGWALMVIIPLGWAIKGAAVIFNAKGRRAVTSIAGDEGWMKVALARLPIMVILAALAYFA